MLDELADRTSAVTVANRPTSEPVVEGSRFREYELVTRLAVRDATESFVVDATTDGGRRRIVMKRPRDNAHAAMFVDDAKVSARLSHAKIVQTLELGHIGEVPYVAIEYVDGVDLLGFLAELARGRLTIDATVAAWIAKEVLDALDHAHTLTDPSGLVHGRLSPTKVLLGVSGAVKLRGFGVARPLELAKASAQDYGHMSPEQVMDLPVDARSDVFGVGILLAEMLVERRLFAARNEFDQLLMVRDVRLARFDAHASRIDGELVSIVRKALERQPDRRWANAAAFRDALDAWLVSHHARETQGVLSMLVAELRAGSDGWRGGSSAATLEFDALDGERDGIVVASAPPAGPKVPGSGPVRTISIPPRPTPPLGRPVVAPAGDAVDLPPAPGALREEPRTQARGTKDLQPDAVELRRARGTVEPAAAGEPPDPRAEPTTPGERQRLASDRIEPVARQGQGRTHLRGKLQPARAGVAGSLEDLLPERIPVVEVAKPTLSAAELAKHGQPVPAKLATLDRPPSEAGAFDRTPPLRVLFRLMATRASGLLSATHQGVRKDIFVSDGRLTGVWSNDERDLFGNYLVAQRVISDGELAMTLATMSHYGGKIGDTLVGLGLLSRVEVFRHLTKHARARVVDLCQWTAGSYAWYAGAEDARASFPLEVDGLSVLGESALRFERAMIDAWLARHRDERLVVAKPLPVSPDAFGLRGATDLLAMLDGARTVRAILQRPWDRTQQLHVGRLLYLLVACELVRVG